MPVSATASSIQTVGDPARPQTDLTFLGELASIAQQVEQYLPQPHGVYGQCAEVLRDRNTSVVQNLCSP